MRKSYVSRNCELIIHNYDLENRNYDLFNQKCDLVKNKHLHVTQMGFQTNTNVS